MTARNVTKRKYFPMDINCFHHCFCEFYYIWARDGLVYTATRYELGGLGFELRWETISFFLLMCVQTGPGAQPAFSTMGNRGSFWGVKRPGRGVNSASPYRAEFKNEYSYTSTSTLSLVWHVMAWHILNTNWSTFPFSVSASVLRYILIPSGHSTALEATHL